MFCWSVEFWWRHSKCLSLERSKKFELNRLGLSGSGRPSQALYKFLKILRLIKKFYYEVIKISFKIAFRCYQNIVLWKQTFQWFEERQLLVSTNLWLQFKKFWKIMAVLIEKQFIKRLWKNLFYILQIFFQQFLVNKFLLVPYIIQLTRYISRFFAVCHFWRYFFHINKYRLYIS